MDTIRLVRVEILIVVALIPDLLAEGDVKADDFFAVFVDLGLQVNVVSPLNLLELLETLVSLLPLLLLLLSQLILIFLFLTHANFIQVIL